MQAVGGKDKKYEEVRNHHRQIESVGVIDAAESAVRELVPIMAQRGLRREKCCDGEKAWHDEGDFRCSLMMNSALLSRNDYKAEAVAGEGEWLNRPSIFGAQAGFRKARVLEPSYFPSQNGPL